MSYRRTGRKPGRPPHPGLLTPAEERVLDGVRRGLTNAQIADELGLATDTVKYHVANMLSKLYFDDRRELAAWEPEPRARQPVFAALANARRVFRPSPQLLGPAFLGGLAVLIAIMALLTVRSDAPRVGGTTPSPTVNAFAFATAPLNLSPLMLVPRAAVAGRKPQFIHDLAGGGTITVGAGTAPAWRPGIDIAAVAVGSRLALFHARLRRWQLSDLPAPVEAAWSPDGDSLAFTARGRDHLYVIDFSSGDVVRANVDRGRLRLPPAPWSADGEEIAVEIGRDVRAWNAVAHGWRTLNEADAQGDARFLGWGEADTAWLSVAGDQPLLRAVDAASAVADVVIPAAFDPATAALAPGGRLIAFRLRGPSSTVAIVRPADLHAVGDVQAPGVLRWSNDGAQLAVYPMVCRPGAGVRVFDIATGHASWLSKLNGTPAWSVDARWIAFARGPGLLVVVGPGGASSRRLLDLPGADGFSVAGWSDSGRFLALSSGTRLRGHCALDTPAVGTGGM